MTTIQPLTSGVEDMPTPERVRAEALDCVAAGRAVVPLYAINSVGTCQCDKRTRCPSGGKHPSVTAWTTTAPMTAEDVLAHPGWATGVRLADGLGVRTGTVSRLTILDEDRVGALDELATLVGLRSWPATREHRSGSGGRHLIYELTDDLPVPSQKLVQGVDVLADRRQAVWPPSRSSKGFYSVANDLPIAPVPRQLLERLRHESKAIPTPSPRTSSDAPVGDFTAYERGAVQDELARLDRLQRPWSTGAAWDATTFEVACNLFDLADSPWTALTREEVADLVRAHAPRDDVWGAAEHEAKLTSASRTVSGRGRSAPDLYVNALNDLPPAPTTATPNTEEPTVVQSEPDSAERDALGVVDLGPVLDGSWEAPAATLLPLDTGGGLIYPGETHSMFGEPGCGKSMAAMAEAARVLTCGGRVAYIDFESSAAVLVSRLRALGTPEAALRERLTYARPEAPFVRWTTPPGGGAPSPTTSPGFRALLEESLDFVVLDGVTAALSLFASPSDDGDAYATWHRAVPQRIAQRTGAAVLMIDHVTKATDTRGRFAIGSQSKLALISGAAYRIDVESPLGPGRVGRLLIKRAKDRHGAVDALVPAGSTTTLPTVAVWSLDARGQRLAVTVTGSALPGAASVVAAAEGDWADSEAVRAVREYLQHNPNARASRKDIEEALGFRRATTREAVDYMIRHGSIRVDGPPKARSTTPTLRLIEVGDSMLTTVEGS